jgi:hypothetical protein
MLISNKFLNANQINYKGIQVYAANATGYTSTDRHVDVIASFYTTMEHACSVNMHKTWKAHKIIDCLKIRGAVTTGEISNIKLHLNEQE